MSVEGKTAVVTGAATGIGRATAELLAARGARVVAAGLQPELLREAVAGVVAAGGAAVAVDADSPTEGAAGVVAAAAQDAFGGADVLVNNAAIYPIGPWHEATVAEWDAVFATNVRAYFLLAQALRPQMLARGGGSIVNVASVTFFWGEVELLSYVASKGAVVGFTRSLAREAGPEGIRVNAVAPGAFPTAATAIHADQDKLWRDVLVGAIHQAPRRGGGRRPRDRVLRRRRQPLRDRPDAARRRRLDAQLAPQRRALREAGVASQRSVAPFAGAVRGWSTRTRSPAPLIVARAEEREKLVGLSPNNSSLDPHAEALLPSGCRERSWG